MEQITTTKCVAGGTGATGMLETALREPQGTDGGAKKPKRFEEVAGFEVAHVVSECPLAILPLGSLEFHGPHNPLGSDSIIISGIAENVAARTQRFVISCREVHAVSGTHGPLSRNAIDPP